MSIKQIQLVDYWQGRDVSHESELTSTIFNNAGDLLTLVNQLLLKLDISTTVRSGWRPRAYNEAIGGAPNSYHITGQAIDLSDPQGRHAFKIIQNYEILSQYGLWIEWPARTRSWVHLDIGKRSARKINTFLP